MKKLPILLICVIAVSFFLFRTMANRSKQTSPRTENKVVPPAGLNQASLKTANSMTAAFTSTKAIRHDKYFDKVAKITNTKIVNEPYSFRRIVNNPRFSKMFETKREVAGFYGTDHYKIAYHIHSARPDPLIKGRILIKGLSNYKKNIRSINGYFDVKAVAVNFKDESDPVYNTNFLIAGVFHFDEAKKDTKVGTYEGNWVMDLSEVNNPYKELEFTYAENGISDGNNFLLNGVWQSTSVEESKSVCFSEVIEKIGSDIFNVFHYGDREIGIRPEFASNGWTDYYENNEWWSGVK